MYWQRHHVVVLSMGISVLLHVLLFSWSYLQPPKLEKRIFRVQRVPPMPVLRPRAFRVPNFKPAVPGEMEMLRRGGGPAYIPEIPLPPAAALGDLREEIERMLMPETDMLSFLQPGAKPDEFTIEGAERIPTAELGIPSEELLPGALEEGITLDIGRKHTLVLVDPQDKTKLKGHLHLPVRKRKARKDLPLIPSEFTHLSYIRHGVGVPLPTFLDIHLHGYASYDSLDIRDLREFPFVIVDPMAGIRVHSIADLADYLEEGGFAMIRQDVRTFRQTLRELQRRPGRCVALTWITLEHPLFHSFYDITEYVSDGITCPYEIAPFPGIEWYGRLVAVSTPLKYLYEYPCVSNKLFINVLVYGLVQPGSIGRQYVSGSTYSHLVLAWGTHLESLDPRQLEVSMDGGEPIGLEHFSEASRYDGIVFRHLTSGKHRLRLRYGNKTIDTQVRLRGGKVTTLKIGVRRIFWVTHLYLKQGSEERYEEWQARLTDLTFIDSRDISLSQ